MVLSRCLAALGLLVASVLGVAPSASASGAVPSQAGAQWVAVSSGPGLRVSGSALSSLPLSSPGSSGLSSLSLRGVALTGWPSLGSEVSPYPTCPPSEYSSPPWSLSSPESPVPLCDPAAYPVPVVLALIELRDLLAFGIGLVVFLLGAHLMVAWSRGA